MQSDYKEIYRLTALRTGKSEELYKEVGNHVFSNLYSFLRRPSALILKLKGVGSWYLRRKRMQIIVDEFPPDFTKTVEDFTSQLSLFKYENKKEIYEIFVQRLKEYEEYILLRDEIREKRYANQKLLEPPNREI